MTEPKDIDLKILNDTIIDYRDQVQRLRECAERLQYETDAIPAIKAERDEYKQRMQRLMTTVSEMTAERDAARGEVLRLNAGWSKANVEMLAATLERDAYAKAADDMAASHKVERDALKDAARLALDLIENMAHFEHEDDPEKPFSEAITALKAVL